MSTKSKQRAASQRPAVGPKVREAAIEERKPTGWFQFIYELAFVFAALLILFAPLHQAATWHLNIDQSLVGNRFRISFPRASELKVGEEFPVYRYAGNDPDEIAKARIETVEKNDVLFSFDPRKAREPVGRHGRITGVENGYAKVSLGSSLGLREGDRLAVFAGRQLLEYVDLTSIDTDTSLGRIAYRPDQTPVQNPVGLSVSADDVMTQVVVFKNPFVSAIEILGSVVVIGGFVVFWIRLRRSPFVEYGSRLMTHLKSYDTATLRLVINVLIGIPFCCLIVKLGVLSLSYIVIQLAPPADNSGWDSPEIEQYLPVLAGIACVFYYVALFTSRSSPILNLWGQLRFKGGLLKYIPQGRWKHWAIWTLHLVITYTFAHTLFGIIEGDMNNMLAVGWPKSNLQVSGGFELAHPQLLGEFIRSLSRAYVYVFTHRPTIQNVDAFYAILRYAIWIFTVTISLYLYLYAVVGYVWGKRIRNLDFTITGWVTNAICYSPLLYVVYWSYFPRQTGLDPIFVSGPLRQMCLAAELFFNLVYLGTILNIGTLFGVMTDKGVRSTGFYGVVRHPSYSVECLMFVAMNLKGVTGLPQWYCLGALAFGYLVRSEREDDFMAFSNPEYPPYRKKTPYKFIPGIF